MCSHYQTLKDAEKQLKRFRAPERHRGDSCTTLTSALTDKLRRPSEPSPASTWVLRPSSLTGWGVFVCSGARLRDDAGWAEDPVAMVDTLVAINRNAGASSKQSVKKTPQAH